MEIVVYTFAFQSYHLLRCHCNFRIIRNLGSAVSRYKERWSVEICRLIIINVWVLTYVNNILIINFISQLQTPY